jgi:hypothetical protein
MAIMDWHLHDFMTTYIRKSTIGFVISLEFFYSEILNLICLSIYELNTHWSSGVEFDVIKQRPYWAIEHKEVIF